VTDVTFRIHFLHSFYTSKHTLGVAAAEAFSQKPRPHDTRTGKAKQAAAAEPSESEAPLH